MAIVTFSEIMNDKKVTILNFFFSNCLTFMSDIVNDKKGNNFMNDISGISKNFLICLQGICILSISNSSKVF